MLSLIQLLAGRPWAIRADLAAHVYGIIAREGFAGLRHFAELKAAMHDDDRCMAARQSVRSGSAGTVAVVPVIGTLTQRGDTINSVETRSTDAVAEEVTALAAEPKVDAVVIELDGPGGEVYGIPEAWEAIHAASKIKPVIAHVNSQAASAHLYLSSAANEVIVTPSGEMGSLGVYALHVDISKALEDMGEKPEFIVADDSPFKTEGNPYEPLSDDARSQLKKTVNRYMSMFVRHEARGREVSVDHVRQNFGKGRMLGPQEAVAAGMADHVGTLEQAIRRAAQLGRERREGGTAARATIVVPEPMAEMPEVPAAHPPSAEPETDPVRAAAAALLGTL